MRLPLLALTAILFLPLTATAQITNLPNTGCKNAGTMLISGSPRIGTTLTIPSSRMPCAWSGYSGFITLSLTGLQAPPLNIGCFNNPCVVIDPTLVFIKPTGLILWLAIPNDVRLVGFKFFVQSGCMKRYGGSCLHPFYQAAQIQITL